MRHFISCTIFKCYSFIQRSDWLICSSSLKIATPLGFVKERNGAPQRESLVGVSGVTAADEPLEAVSGTRGKTSSQSDPGPVLHREMFYLLALPSSHDSAPTSEPELLVTWGERPRLTAPRPQLLPLLGKPVLFAMGSQSRRGGYGQTIPLKAGGSESNRQPAAGIRRTIHPAQKKDLMIWCNYASFERKSSQ